MKTIIKLVTVLLFAVFSVSAMAQVADCKHDVAPYDVGRYARDVKAGKNIQLSKVPVRTVWDTNMKGGKWITCRTTQERTIALLEDGTYYDIGCGNEIKIAMPPTPLQSQIAQAPSFLTAQAPLVCKDPEECKQVKWCDENSGWYASKDDKGNHVRRCEIPGRKSIITQNDEVVIEKHTKVSGHVSAEFTGWTGSNDINVPPAPALDVNLGRTAAPAVSGEKCTAEKCEARETFKKVSSVSADFCGIRTNSGDVIAFLDKGGKLQAVKNPVFDRSSGKAKVVRAEHDMVFNQVSTAQFNNNCRTVLDTVEVKGWSQMVKDLKLPPACTPAGKLAPASNKFGNV